MPFSKNSWQPLSDVYGAYTKSTTSYTQRSLGVGLRTLTVALREFLGSSQAGRHWLSLGLLTTALQDLTASREMGLSSTTHVPGWNRRDSYLFIGFAALHATWSLSSPACHMVPICFPTKCVVEC